ncbi:glycosyltransferase [Candidatus Collierbacteria bacterium]|nr:glycosyltransferase [Candidatus Collierbacteria bacterium]
MDLSICIVNYRVDKELKRCLESVKKFIKGVSYEIIVIDNSVNNSWYSGGNNLALAKARGRYILFLNPDCYLTENSLAKMVRWMDKHPEVGVSESRQVYDDGKIAPTGSLLPKWWVDGVELTGLSRWAPKYVSFVSWSSSTQPKSTTSRFGRTGEFFQRKNTGSSEEIGGIFVEMMKYRQVNNDRRKNWKTEVVSGAAMMVRKIVLDQIGGFDEKLKLYYTDVDLCRRILAAEFEVWHLGEFKLGHSTRKSTDKMKWDDVYDIYAGDARNYYRKWGDGIGGMALFLAMKLNKIFVKLGKELGR